MSADTRYTIAIEGPGVKITREVSEGVGQKAIVLILTGSDAETTSRTVDTNSAACAGTECVSNQEERPALSLGEFISDHNAKRFPDKIVAIGCYIDKHRGIRRFSRDDLKTLFVEAAENIPTNLTRDIRWALSNKWIAIDPNTKSYYVTGRGVDAVKEKFPKSVINKTPLPRPTKRDSSKKNGEDKE